MALMPCDIKASKVLRKLAMYVNVCFICKTCEVNLCVVDKILFRNYTKLLLGEMRKKIWY